MTIKTKILNNMESDQERLLKIVDVIKGSKNIDPKIKEIFSRVSLTNIIDESFGLNTDSIFQLYKARNNRLKDKGINNHSFTSFLDQLSGFNESTLNITYFEIDDKGYVLFTDSNYKLCLGILYKK